MLSCSCGHGGRCQLYDAAMNMSHSNIEYQGTVPVSSFWRIIANARDDYRFIFLNPAKRSLVTLFSKIYLDDHIFIETFLFQSESNRLGSSRTDFDRILIFSNFSQKNV